MVIDVMNVCITIQGEETVQLSRGSSAGSDVTSQRVDASSSSSSGGGGGGGGRSSSRRWMRMSGPCSACIVAPGSELASFRQRLSKSYPSKS